MDASQDLVIHLSRKKLALVAAGALGFVVAGLLLAALSYRRQVPGGVGVLGLVTVVFFGLCAAYAFTRLAVRSPALIVESRGIVDHASALGTGLIRWEEIKDVRIYRFRNQLFLGIEPVDIARFVNNQPAWKRYAITVSLAMGTAPINIPQNVVPVPLSELLATIQERRRER